jgi:uncharacterized membrane protein YgcG
VRWLDLGTLPLTVIVSLLLAVVLLAMRVFVMQRVQTARQRENRQESERLRSLVAAYRALAGSFSPAAPADRVALESALSDIVLFGSVRQVELAAAAAHNLAAGASVDYQTLVEDLRADLRRQLGLEPIPAHVDIPTSGPGASPRGGRGEGGGREGGRGEGGGGGGMGMGGAGALGVGGVGLGMAAGEAGEPR